MNTVQRWFTKIKNNILLYRDGFFELPFLANSPELIFGSMGNMPFMKNYPKKNYLTTNSPFLKGDCHYQKLEDGLWIAATYMEIKRDLSFKFIYDPEEPSNYHFLSLHINKNETSVKNPKLAIKSENIDKSWLLFKAGSHALNSHFKGQKYLFLTIYFTDEWLNVNSLSKGGVLKSDTLSKFFSSSDECLFLPDFLEEKKDDYLRLITSLNDKDDNGVKNLLEVKLRTLDLIKSFVKKLDNDDANISSITKFDKKSRPMVKAAYLIKEAKLKKFPTIPYLASEVGVSETKLKNDFKSMYGCTMLQYHSKLQMNFAKRLLEKKEYSVNDVAHVLQYANVSKFSAAFKREYGLLPSDL